MILPFISLAVTCVLGSILKYCDAQEFVVKSTKYGKIRGIVTERVPGNRVEQYLGVPYAAPPVGQLRFERPQEPSPWDNIRNASAIPPACPQMIDFSYIQLHTQFDIESEDCLYLNLYVPQTESTSQKFPVLLYIHGGSNEVGMGAMFDGDVLTGFGDIIVITFNYRLGAFGFLGAKDENLEGNYGFLDQVAAMRWVQENIHHFNGDKARVTIDGHSAGAADVGFHLVSPITKGLFQFAIIQSGSPLAFWAMSKSEWKEGYNIDEKCTKTECVSGKRSSSLWSYKEYLKTLPTRVIQNMSGKPTPGNLITFPAVVDGFYMPERPEAVLRRGEFHGDGFLLTFTKDEGSNHAAVLNEHYNGSFTESSFVDVINLYKSAYAVCGLPDIILHEYGGWNGSSNKSSPLARFTEMESDFVFVAPIIHMADIMARTTDNLFVLSFDHESDRIVPQSDGVPHGRELFYQFGAPLVGHPLYEFSNTDKIASKLMMRLWSNFVKYGYLTMDGNTRLPAYGQNTQTYTRLLSIEEDVVLLEAEKYKPRKMSFWNHLLPLLGSKSNCDLDDLSALSSSDRPSSPTKMLLIVILCVCIYM